MRPRKSRPVSARCRTRRGSAVCSPVPARLERGALVRALDMQCDEAGVDDRRQRQRQPRLAGACAHEPAARAPADAGSSSAARFVGVGKERGGVAVRSHAEHRRRRAARAARASAVAGSAGRVLDAVRPRDRAARSARPPPCPAAACRRTSPALERGEVGRHEALVDQRHRSPCPSRSASPTALRRRPPAWCRRTRPGSRRRARSIAAASAAGDVARQALPPARRALGEAVPVR